jgi:hypothetical protein
MRQLQPHARRHHFTGRDFDHHIWTVWRKPCARRKHTTTSASASSVKLWCRRLRGGHVESTSVSHWVAAAEPAEGWLAGCCWGWHATALTGERRGGEGARERGSEGDCTVYNPNVRCTVWCTPYTQASRCKSRSIVHLEERRRRRRRRRETTTGDSARTMQVVRRTVYSRLRAAGCRRCQAERNVPRASAAIGCTFLEQGSSLPLSHRPTRILRALEGAMAGTGPLHARPLPPVPFPFFFSSSTPTVSVKLPSLRPPCASP